LIVAASAYSNCENALARLRENEHTQDGEDETPALKNSTCSPTEKASG
jgi:hypothetical protein